MKPFTIKDYREAARLCPEGACFIVSKRQLFNNLNDPIFSVDEKTVYWEPGCGDNVIIMRTRPSPSSPNLIEYKPKLLSNKGLLEKFQSEISK